MSGLMPFRYFYKSMTKSKKYVGYVVIAILTVLIISLFHVSTIEGEYMHMLPITCYDDWYEFCFLQLLNKESDAKKWYILMIFSENSDARLPLFLK